MRGLLFIDTILCDPLLFGVKVIKCSEISGIAYRSTMLREGDVQFNVLNNKKPKEDKEHKAGRISIKEKLAEKKAVIEQKDRAGKEVPEKETEKKTEREI